MISETIKAGQMKLCTVMVLLKEEAEKWSLKSKIWKPKISSFVIKKP